MKKKVLSLLLAVCLVVGMLPLAASAAEGDAFKVGEVTFSTLKDAVEAAGAEGTVEAIGVYTVTTEDATALAGAKTTDVVVKNGASVTVSEDALASLLTYSGKITVEAGGALTLPEKSGGMEPWFGGKDARMNITAGSVIISQLNKATEGGCVWSLSEDAVVEVPAAQEAFLHVNNFGVKLDIPEGANLVVNGTLRAISGTKPSTLFIRGTVTVNKDATMTVAEKATAEIGATGALNVKAESNFTVAENVAMSDENVQREYREISRECGITLTALSVEHLNQYGLSHPMNSRRGKIALEGSRIGLETAARMDIPVVQLPSFNSGAIRTEEDFENTCEKIALLCEEAEQYGIIVADHSDVVRWQEALSQDSENGGFEWEFAHFPGFEGADGTVYKSIGVKTLGFAVINHEVIDALIAKSRADQLQESAENG